MQGKRRANALKDAEKILDSLNVYTVEEIQRGTRYPPYVTLLHTLTYCQVLSFRDKRASEKASVSVSKDPSNSRLVNIYITEVTKFHK